MESLGHYYVSDAKIAHSWAKNIFQEVENPRCKKSELTGI